MALDMFNERVEFGNIIIEVDPVNRERTEDSDNVMAIFHEEQPLMWEYVRVEIERAISMVQGSIDFLDVGTGSGVWSILIAKNIQARNISAIDKSDRAIAKTIHNAKLNEVCFETRQELYNISTIPYRSAKVIGIYAPYHLYPPEVEMKVPQHARGGIDGQQVFKEQLVIANYHLAKQGILVFNQMCLGRKGRPEFAHYISHLMKGVSLEYVNIFPPIETYYFLKNLYGDTFENYVDSTSIEFPELYFCDGIIRRDGKGKVIEGEYPFDLKGRSWASRIAIHQELVKHQK